MSGKRSEPVGANGFKDEITAKYGIPVCRESIESSESGMGKSSEKDVSPESGERHKSGVSEF
jgi:hypothetical protein